MVINKHTGETDCLEAAVVDAVEVIGAIAFRDSRDHDKVQETEESIRLSCGWYVRKPQLCQRLVSGYSTSELTFLLLVVLLRAEVSRSLAAIRAV